MQAFRVHTGIVAPLDRANVDTDAIIPKQFLKSIKRSGFGPNLFDAWRYTDRGEPGMDPASRHPNPGFVLNEPRYRGASTLLAPSYADIFFNNCFKNGLLPIVLAERDVDRLFADVAAFPGFRLTVDLERKTVATVDGAGVFAFDVDPFRRQCLLNGWDDIGLTLRHADEIRAFEAKHFAEQPWLA